MSTQKFHFAFSLGNSVKIQTYFLVKKKQRKRTCILRAIVKNKLVVKSYTFALQNTIGLHLTKSWSVNAYKSFSYTFSGNLTAVFVVKFVYCEFFNFYIQTNKK